MSHTIALVDDDRNILTSISMALENEGFKVQTYIDAETAYNFGVFGVSLGAAGVILAIIAMVKRK